MNIKYSDEIFSIELEFIDESSHEKGNRLKINNNYVSDEINYPLDNFCIEIKNCKQIYPLRLSSIPLGCISFSLEELFIDYYKIIEISRNYNEHNRIQLSLVCFMQHINPYLEGTELKKLNSNEVKESVLNLYIKYKDKSISVLLKDLQEYRESFCIDYFFDCQHFLTIEEFLRILNRKHEIKDFIDFELFSFGEILNDIDLMLAEEGVPIQRRVFKAAMRFVRYTILEYRDKTCKPYYGAVWFKALFNLINQWYHERYGDLKRFKLTYSAVSAIGVVLIHDTPFEINIPFSISKKLDDGDIETCFLNSIKDNEDVLKWIKDKPNLEFINKDEIDRLEEDLKHIGLAYRKINRALTSAVLEKKDKKDCFTILKYLQTAAHYIMNQETSQSYWEVHMAIEKAVKLILKQNNRGCPPTHDLEKLRKLATNIKGVNLENEIFSMFPSDKEAINQRYGDGKAYSMQEAVSNYISACSVISILTGKLKKNEKFHSEFYILTNPSSSRFM